MIIDCGVYRGGQRAASFTSLAAALDCARGASGAAGEGDFEPAFVWLDLDEPSSDELIEVADAFALPAALTDHLAQHHPRPTVTDSDGWTVVVLRTARYDEPASEVEFGEVTALLSRDALVVARHGQASRLAPARRYFDNHAAHARLGPAAALHTVVAHVIDDYAAVLDGIDEDIDEVEQEVFAESPALTNESGGPTARIYYLKREAMELSRALGAMIEPLDRIADGEVDHIDDPLCEHFRQVYVGAMRFRDHAISQRELLTSILEANLTRVSIRQNEDMRRISAWAAIVAVPTLIAGIYGMNFRHMPELEAKVGYPLALGAMLVICTALYRSFKRAGWL